MKRRSRKPSAAAAAAAALLSTPPPPPAAVSAGSPTLSTAEFPAEEFELKLNGFKDIATSSKTKSNKNVGASASSSKLKQTTGFSPLSPNRSLKSASTISDLKDLASSNLDSIKRHLDRSQSEILKDIEASQCRLQKRFKFQTQACQQTMDEAEKEYKKMSERISEGREAMKASYAEFIAEAHASTSRLSRTNIPEIIQTFEEGIASVRSKYGISSTAV